MKKTLVHLGLVSMVLGSYPKNEIKITFKLDKFMVQLGSYTSSLVHMVSKPL